MKFRIEKQTFEKMLSYVTPFTTDAVTSIEINSSKQKLLLYFIKNAGLRVFCEHDIKCKGDKKIYVENLRSLQNALRCIDKDHPIFSMLDATIAYNDDDTKLSIPLFDEEYAHPSLKNMDIDVLEAHSFPHIVTTTPETLKKVSQAMIFCPTSETVSLRAHDGKVYIKFKTALPNANDIETVFGESKSDFAPVDFSIDGIKLLLKRKSLSLKIQESLKAAIFEIEENGFTIKFLTSSLIPNEK